MKKYWLKHEIPIAEELMSLAPKLLQEFLDFHPDWLTGGFKDGRSHDFVNWKTEGLKYTHPYAEPPIVFNGLEQPDIVAAFPTAAALTEKYFDDCPSSLYSTLEPGIIPRHTGKENRDNEYLRIHVPLHTPAGDIFFECEGVEIDWTDLWGFNNQLIHSAHNYTGRRRLIYMIDISYKRLGLEIQPKYNPIRELRIPAFVRGKLPKQLHAHQELALKANLGLKEVAYQSPVIDMKPIEGFVSYKEEEALRAQKKKEQEQ